MGTSLRLRTFAVAVLSGMAVAAYGITQAHAFSPGPLGGASVHFSLPSTGTLTVHVTVRQPVKTLSVRLDRGSWIHCRVHGVRATCPAPHANLARLATVDVLATR